jgi:hypothetical protein
MLETKVNSTGWAERKRSAVAGSVSETDDTGTIRGSSIRSQPGP